MREEPCSRASRSYRPFLLSRAHDPEGRAAGTEAVQQHSAGKRNILIRPRIGNKKLVAAKQGETRHTNCPDSKCATVKAAAVHSNHCMAPCSAVYRLRGSQLPCNGEMLPSAGRKATGKLAP